MKRFITHVKKDSYDRIIAVKTMEIVLNTSNVVDRIKKNVDSFHVKAGSGEVGVAVYRDVWIRSHANGVWTDNLDNLPRF